MLDEWVEDEWMEDYWVEIEWVTRGGEWVLLSKGCGASRINARIAPEKNLLVDDDVG